MPVPEEHSERDEELGRRVRILWSGWAASQPDVKEHPGWLTPWDDMDERFREVDRLIGRTLWLDGYVAAKEDILGRGQDTGPG